MHNTDYRRIIRSSIHLTSNQAIKVNFRGSKILIPVANGSTGLVSVTTPCLAKLVSVRRLINFYFIGSAPQME